jgi:hypothetical protein
MPPIAGLNDLKNSWIVGEAGQIAGVREGESTAANFYLRHLASLDVTSLEAKRDPAALPF